MERQSKGSRCLEAYCNGGQGPPLAVALLKKHHISTIFVLHYYCIFCITITYPMGLESAVEIATRYGLDGQGIESRWGRNFPHPSRLALVPTQPLVQWVPGLSRG